MQVAILYVYSFSRSNSSLRRFACAAKIAPLAYNRLMNDGRPLIIGCSQKSRNFLMFSVILLTLDTMGLIPIGFLWIFFRKYSCDVLWFLGGLQKSTIFTCSSFDLYSFCRKFWICCLVSSVVSRFVHCGVIKVFQAFFCIIVTAIDAIWRHVYNVR